MKRAKLGDVVRYEGRLAEVIGHSDGRTIILRFCDNPPCEHCGRADPMPHLVEESRLFQDGVEPVTTVAMPPILTGDVRRNVNCTGQP